MRCSGILISWWHCSVLYLAGLYTCACACLFLEPGIRLGGVVHSLLWLACPQFWVADLYTVSYRWSLAAIGSVAGLSPGYSSGEIMYASSNFTFHEVGHLILLTPGCCFVSTYPLLCLHIFTLKPLSLPVFFLLPYWFSFFSFIVFLFFVRSDTQ